MNELIKSFEAWRLARAERRLAGLQAHLEVLNRYQGKDGKSAGILMFETAHLEQRIAETRVLISQLKK